MNSNNPRYRRKINSFLEKLILYFTLWLPASVFATGTISYSTIPIPDSKCLDISHSASIDLQIRINEVTSCKSEVIKSSLYNEKEFYVFYDHGFKPSLAQRFGPFPESEVCSDDECKTYGQTQLAAKESCDINRSKHISQLPVHPIHKHYVCSDAANPVEVIQSNSNPATKISQCQNLKEISGIDSLYQNWVCYQ